MERGAGGYRDKMRDECVRAHSLLLRRKRLTVREMADELGISERTAYRWIGSFSLTLPIRLDRGTILVGEFSGP
jgi:predicted DNA-binding transcriptional regulator YafY